jgi:Uma2 family endonuclease
MADATPKENRLFTYAVEMERKFELYQNAGVREYWIVKPEQKKVMVYYFQGKEITVHSYGAGDTIPVTVLQGLTIYLESVFAE